MKEEEYKEAEEHFEALRKKKISNPIYWILFVVAGVMAFVIFQFGLGGEKQQNTPKSESPRILYYFSPAEEIPQGALAVRTKINTAKKLKPEFFREINVYGQPAKLYIYPEMKFKIIIGKESLQFPVVVNRKDELSFLVYLSKDIGNIEKIDKLLIDTPEFKSLYFNVPVKNKILDLPPIIYYY